MNTLGVLQLDTIPIICRPQHLVPYSRLGLYSETLLNDVAYKDDKWIESWAHEAALIPVESEPYFRWRQKEMATKGHWSAVTDRPEYVEQVYNELVKRGPLTAGELPNNGEKVGTDHAWGGRSPGRLALGQLFASGRAGSRRVGNFERQFDTIERIVPAEIRATPDPGQTEAQTELLRRAATSLGVGTADDIADYYRIPLPQARPLIANLVSSGDLTEVVVEGWNKPAFRAAGSKLPRKMEASALLSPFDPVVWHRPRAERLFNFYYRIEIYVPAAKRVYGYYVLPYLLGSQLVARVDVKAERSERTLQVKGAWCESHAKPNDVAGPLSKELCSLAAFQQLDRVAVAANGNLAKSLLAALPKSVAA